MTDGVSKIQNLAEAGFALVNPDDFRFRANATLEHPVQRPGMLAEQRLHAAFQKSEERRIANHSVFDDFVQPRAILACRQSGQQLWIGQNQAGLIEGTHQILSFRKVYSRLAADAAVNLREQRGGNVDDSNSPSVACRHEARYVADYAAAQPAAQKIKRKGALALDLKPTADILADLDQALAAI